LRSPNAEQAEFWAGVAPAWIELEAQFERVGGPPGDLAMDRLGLAGGERVVDVGCGLGPTTRALAARLGAAGEAVGVDISEEMLATARRHAEQAGTANVRFVFADVQEHDLGDAAFDAAFSRFGVMFFADPVAAFSNIRRSLRAGGQLSFVCWQTVFDNEWMLVPGMAAMSVVGDLSMPEPDEPGPFSLADPEKVRAVLGAAGFAQIEVEPHNDLFVESEDRIPRVVEASVRGRPSPACRGRRAPGDERRPPRHGPGLSVPDAACRRRRRRARLVWAQSTLARSTSPLPTASPE
jgi:SAM-dependent methyltransferase